MLPRACKQKRLGDAGKRRRAAPQHRIGGSALSFPSLRPSLERERESAPALPVTSRERDEPGAKARVKMTPTGLTEATPAPSLREMRLGGAGDEKAGTAPPAVLLPDRPPLRRHLANDAERRRGCQH